MRHNLIATNAANLTNAVGLALDYSDNIYVTIKSNTVLEITAPGVSNVVATITNAGANLQGLVLKQNGLLAVCDSGRNGIYLIDPASGVVTTNAGFNGAGDFIHTSNVDPISQAKFFQPVGVAETGDGNLIVTDFGNHRVKVVTSLYVTNLYGVTSNDWLYLPSKSFYTNWPGFADGTVVVPDNKVTNNVEARKPFGVTIAPDGTVYVTEDFYHIIRHITAGFTPPHHPPQSWFFKNPAGIALNTEFTGLFIADPATNRIGMLNLANNQTTAYLTNNQTVAYLAGKINISINKPVDVALDGSDNLYVLNQGTGGNGSILKFDRFGNLLGTNVAGLALPAAMTMDSSGDIFVAGQSNQLGVVQMFNSGNFNQAPTNTIATVTNPGVSLQGIALFDNGTIVVSDSTNHVLWQVNPVTKAVSLFTGQIGNPGTTFGSNNVARLYQPHRLARAAGDLLLAADSGNKRVVVINDIGSITNSLVSTNGLVWFDLPGDPVAANSLPMVSPIGLAISGSGGVFASESFYNDIREMLATGYAPAGSGGGSTNPPAPPTITPNSGYYPMGQTILVSSANPVYYTTDGSTPTTNSAQVNLSGNIGYIHWSNSTNDLTWLHLRSFVDNNGSATVGGLPAATNNIGTPPDFNPSLQAGIGSTVVIPVVCNLATNEQIMSYQFRCEIYPINNPNTPVIIPLSIFPTNDFIPVVTAIQQGQMGTFNYVYYTYTNASGIITNGIRFSTAITNGNNGNTSFKNYAVVQMLEVQIPYAANLGDTYGLNILYPSATSDGYNHSVPLTPMAPVTIVVTNVPYVVGDSASASGTWYNAGTFGDDNLDNSDVNQAFFASSGLRVPYSFSDVFNAMDAYPPDGNGYVGGDGQIRFLDWQTILNRSLRLDTNDWSRAWSAGGYLVDVMTNLVVPHVVSKPANQVIQKTVSSPWYRQALVGAGSVSYASPGSTVNVPVYVTLQDNATLSGLQFRTVITPQNGAPLVTNSPQLSLASGVTSPYLHNSFKAAEAAFGWNLGSFGYLSRSSNFLGWVSFTVPAAARSGQAYTVSFANVDGSPDLNTQYDFESRSATVTVNGASPLASICSDEWKIHFFGSTTNPAAADNADPDGDGVPNWMEYLTGTDPTSPQSKLQVGIIPLSGGKIKTPTQLNWLTAPGKAYALQFCTNLASGNWNTIATVSGSGAATNCPDSGGSGGTRFYRLQVLP
jgi:hypothetical protein